MEIRKAAKEDLTDLAGIYKSAFEKHLIFEKDEQEVIDYLTPKLNNMIVAVDGRVIGGCIIKTEIENPSHKLSRIQHLAVAPEMQSMGVGTELVKEAEKIIGRGKIEVRVAEGEAIEFYRKLGYTQEGALTNHYRKNETVLVLGKNI